MKYLGSFWTFFPCHTYLFSLSCYGGGGGGGGGIGGGICDFPPFLLAKKIAIKITAMIATEA